MARINRRSFVERIGLGAGAFFLSPILTGLVNEARGAAPTRKRLLFVVQGNGMNYRHCFTPSELQPKLDDAAGFTTRDFSWPSMMTALAPYRGRMLLLESCSNYQAAGVHSCGYSALCCIPNVGDPQEGLTLIARRARVNTLARPGEAAYTLPVRSCAGRCYCSSNLTREAPGITRQRHYRAD